MQCNENKSKNLITMEKEKYIMYRIILQKTLNFKEIDCQYELRQ